MKRLLLVLMVMIPATFFSQTMSSSMPSNHHVSAFYLVPSDYDFSQDEYNTIISTMHEVQAWYQIAIGGMTITLEDDGVPTVIYLANNAAYYETNYWGNILDELVTLGINNWEEQEIKMMFLRAGGGLAGAAQGCLGECGVGMIGMDLWPEFNSGQFIDCPGGEGIEAWPCTPLGATVHELGHALGLAHPNDVGQPWNVARHSVMQTHWNYPYWHANQAETPWSLLTVERQHLRTNPFISHVDVEIIQPYEEMPVCNIPSNGAEPIAGFNYEINGLEVTFTNTSTGANLYYWTFGDGSVSSEEDPTYEFSEYGVHTVRLRASSSTSMMSMIEITIPVCNLSTGISATAEDVCSGQTVILTASGGTEYLWSSGQNTSTIEEQVYETGEYTVTISEANGCYAEESITIYATPSPDPFITTSTNEEFICEGQSLELEVSGGGDYLWSTGETDYQITVEPEVTTLYEVEATNSFGCTASASITISVHPIPVATLTVSDTQLCRLDTATLTAGGGLLYQWNNGSTAMQIKVAPIDTTTYSVVVTNAYGCADQESVELIVLPVPIVSIAMTDSIVCQGDSLTLTVSGEGEYYWSNHDSLATTLVQVVGDTSYRVTITNEHGCSDHAAVDIVVYTLADSVIQVSGDTVCVGEIVILSGPDAATYQWNTGDTTAIITHSYSDTSDISLIVTDTNQCAYHLETDVYVRPQSPLLISGPAFICAEDTILLMVQPGYPVYEWSTGCTGESCQVTMSGPVMVAVTDSSGCRIEATVDIAGDDTEVLEIEGNKTFCEGDSTILTVPHVFPFYQWSSGDSVASINLKEGGTYTVTVTGVYGCQNTASVQIQVEDFPHFVLEFDGDEILPTGLDTGVVHSYLWSTGGTDKTLAVSTSGTYCLTVTSPAGCASDTCLAVIISGDDLLTANHFKVYPNPFTDHVIIESSDQLPELIGVLDMMQQPVKVRTIVEASRLEVGFGSVPTGIYVLILRTQNGSIRVHKVFKH